MQFSPQSLQSQWNFAIVEAMTHVPQKITFFDLNKNVELQCESSAPNKHGSGSPFHFNVRFRRRVRPFFRSFATLLWGTFFGVCGVEGLVTIQNGTSFLHHLTCLYRIIITVRHSDNHFPLNGQ